MKDGEGSIFKNAKKLKESDPDYSGTFRLSGTDYAIIGYKKTAKTGTNYLRLLVRPKNTAPASDPNDAIGF
jgi:hypothetical protein